MGAPGTFSGGQPGVPLYSPKLQAVLKRLDNLVDWERRMRGGSAPGAMRQQRTSNSAARTLLSRLGNLQQGLQTVHVTGSKGKGTVATLITAALLRAPFVVSVIGTYGSPHVERINERVLLNARPVPDDDLAQALSRVLDARERDPVLEDATWFDVMSVSGLAAFQRARARWAVVEVGMGGRLDSTNVLDAPVSVVTNVHLEHAEIIGPTLLDIAYEKAGIIAPGAHVVVGMHHSDDLATVFSEEAAGHYPPARVQFCPPQPGGTIFEHNLALARAAVTAVACREGVESARPEELLPRDLAKEALSSLPARQERFMVALSDEQTDTATVPVLLDGGHVPESVASVLHERTGDRPPVVLLGVGREKDVSGICRVVHASSPEHVFASVTGPQSPYLPASALAEVLKTTGKTPVSAVEEAEKALQKALSFANARQTDLVIIGSLHFAGRLRPSLRRRQQQSHSKF